MACVGIKITIVTLILAVNTYLSLQCPMDQDAKAAYKSGEVKDQSTPITLERIKNKLRDSGVFDWQHVSLTAREKKELAKLFDAVEIMTTSRNRQPSTIQNIFASLRMVERAVKKQLKEGQISQSLANKFNWDKITARHKRGNPVYYLDNTTKMRVFYTDTHTIKEK